MRILFLSALPFYVVSVLSADEASGGEQSVYQKHKEKINEINVYQYLKGEYKIKITEKGSLKDVFDSGVRPYRFPGLERTSLEFTNSYVSFTDQSGFKTERLPAQWVHLGVLEKGLLSRIKVRTVPLKISEAELMMASYLKWGTRTNSELKEFLEAVEKDSNRFSDAPSKWQDNFGFGWESDSGPSYHVSFKKTYQEDRPLTFNLILNWKKFREPIEMRTFYSGPIPPPEGYSDVSMVAPEIYGPGTYLHDIIGDLSTSRSELKKQVSTSQSTISVSLERNELKDKRQESKSLIKLLYLILGSLLLVGIALAFRNIRKGSSAS